MTTEYLSVTDQWNLKSIPWPPKTSKSKRIITQNLNGPCSLIAICNILILQNNIEILPPDRPSVSYEYLSSLLADFLLASASSASAGDLSAALSRLPDTQRGLNVNPLFTGVSSFRGSGSDGELQLFALCNLKLVHGWLPDPASPEHLVLMTVEDYDTAVNVIVAAQEIAARDPTIPSAVDPSRCSSPHLSLSSTPPIPEDSCKSSQEPVKEETSNDGSNNPVISVPSIQINLSHPESTNQSQQSESTGQNHSTNGSQDALDVDSTTLRDALLIQQFLEMNSTQLTYHGLFTLFTSLDEGLYPFFRNSHLSVLYKYHSPDGSPSLWTLVTDSNFAKEPAVVWESLEDVDGGASRFVDGNFLASSTAGGDFAGRSAEQALQDTERKKLPETLHSDFALAQHLQAEEEALAHSAERLNITPRDETQRTQSSAGHRMAHSEASPSSSAAQMRPKAASTSDLRGKGHELGKKPSCVFM